MRRKNKTNMKELSFVEYAELFLQIVPKVEKVDSVTYRGRCPICGDSKKDIHKKRFYLLKERGRFPNAVKCHNCGYKTSACHFFQEYAPEEMKKRSKSWSERDLSDIKKLSEEGSLFKPNKIIEGFTPDDFLVMFDEELVRAKKVLCNFFRNYTYSISSNVEALNYMRGRNIPEHYIKEMRLLKPEYFDFNKFRYAYFREYIMMPFIDLEDNLPYYFHSRRYLNLNTKMAPYLACPYRPEEVDVNFFMNELRVTTDEPIIVVEGTLDSMHLHNSIAMNGIHKITEEQIKKFEHRYGTNIIYALDNELIDRDSKKKSTELLRLNKNVFLWRELAKELPIAAEIKDFNKLCCVAGRYEIPTETILRNTRSNVGALL